MVINRGLVPGTFTMGNVVCGLIAILNVLEGHPTTACWFIVLAAFLDVLDGKVARLSGGTSQFGVELDSLADFLSFGVAPAVLVYATALKELGKWGWIISIVYIMAAAYRLARYNVLADTEEKRDFLGLPVPGAALPLVTFIIFSYSLFGGLEYAELLISMVILFSFLMVSQVQYDVVPDRLELLARPVKMAVVIGGPLVLLAAILWPRLVLFPLFSLYILLGIVRESYRLLNIGVGKVTTRTKQRRRSEEEEWNERQH